MGGKEAGRKEAGETQSVRAEQYTTASHLFCKCFSVVILATLVEVCHTYMEILKIYPKGRQILKTFVQCESCFIDLTLTQLIYKFKIVVTSL